LSSLPFNITQNLNTLDQQGVAVNVSKNGGKTWFGRQWLGTSQDAFNSPDSGIFPFDDKDSCTADPNHPKNAYVVRERFDCFSCATFFHAPTLFNRTTDSGKTWSNFTIIYDPLNDTSIAPFVAQSTFNNTIVVLPKRFPFQNLQGDLLNFMTRDIVDPSNASFFDVALIRSKDLGLTWDTTATSVLPIVAVEPNGLPGVFTGGYTYDSLGNITGGIGTLMRTSASGEGFVFSVNENPKTGVLYLVFQSTQFRSDFLSQIGLTISRDGGFTWSAPVMINRTPQNVPNPQAFTPAVAITKYGDVGVLYSDFRFDNKKNPNETKTNTWLAIYKEVDDPDGGSTGVGLDFVQELRLSKKSYIAQNGPVTTTGTMTNGDYSSLVAHDETFYAAFTQSHNGPFKPQFILFEDVVDQTTLFVDDNYRQSPYVSVIKKCNHRQR
jgi:hypothetical protein